MLDVKKHCKSMKLQFQFLTLCFLVDYAVHADLRFNIIDSPNRRERLLVKAVKHIAHLEWKSHPFNVDCTSANLDAPIIDHQKTVNLPKMFCIKKKIIVIVVFRFFLEFKSCC